MSFFGMRLFMLSVVFMVCGFGSSGELFWLNYLKHRKNIFLMQDDVEQNFYLCNNNNDL